MSKRHKDKKTTWQKDNLTKRYCDKKAKRQKDRKTKRQKIQKDKDQKESFILRRRGSFALLRCFFHPHTISGFICFLWYFGPSPVGITQLSCNWEEATFTFPFPLPSLCIIHIFFFKAGYLKMWCNICWWFIQHFPKLDIYPTKFCLFWENIQIHDATRFTMNTNSLLRYVIHHVWHDDDQHPCVKDECP